MRSKRGFWMHHCRTDHGWFGVAADEECTWCGRTEEDEPAHRITAAPPIQYQLERSPVCERV